MIKVTEIIMAEHLISCNDARNRNNTNAFHRPTYFYNKIIHKMSLSGICEHLSKLSLASVRFLLSSLTFLGWSHCE